MSARITVRVNKNLTHDLLECRQLQVYHFVMFFNDQMTPEEAEELTDHVRKCDACQLMFDEVEAALVGQNRNQASRAELLTFLKCLMDPLWGLEKEPSRKLLRKHHLKTKKRIAKLERRVKELEQLLKQFTPLTEVLG